MQFLIRFLKRFWHGLDVLRRVLHLLLLLLFFGLILAAMRGTTPPLPGRGALVIRPEGEIVEQLSGEPFERALNEAQGQQAPQTLLWDLTDAIRAAAKDEHVSALLIDTDKMESVGQARLEELAAAIAEFRASNKKVVAYGQRFEQSQYYLAAQADEIYLDPLGLVLFTGYGRYAPYLKEALDRLSIDVHLYRAGRFKSAAEPFVRKDMSPEDREETQAYIQSLWKTYRAVVAKARGLKPDDITHYVESLAAGGKTNGGDLAALAKTAGLVTDLRTPQQVAQRMVELVGVESKSEDPLAFRQIRYHDYLRTIRAKEKLKIGDGGAVGVIFANGEILDGRQPAGAIGGENTAELLHRARLDKEVKALVLRIDSPGGSVTASEEIYREVVAFKESGKPLVVSMGDLAASGGYYIAAPADEIIASPNTLTGSIGVFGVLPTVDRALGKLGVNIDGIGTTPYSGLSPLRPMSPAVDQLLQSGVARNYEIFLSHVASGRHKTRDEVDRIAQGRVWAGSDAQPIGLVDRFGTYRDALEAAATRAHLPAGYPVKRIETDRGFFDRLLSGFSDESMDSMARIAVTMAPRGVGGVPLNPQWLIALQPVSVEVQRLQRYALARQPVAYCFCRAD